MLDRSEIDSQYYECNYYTKNSCNIHDSDYYNYPNEEINYGQNKAYTIAKNMETSSQSLSPVGSDLSEDFFNQNMTNQDLQEQLMMKTKQVENLKNELESISKLYSEENLRQLEEMNRLIAVILEEKHQSTSRLESKIREQNDTICSLAKKLNDKDLLINRLNEENAILQNNVNVHVDNHMNNHVHVPMENKQRFLNYEKFNNSCSTEDQCHHPNARRISPVEPWRKFYVKDTIEHDGRTWYWCAKHKMPDYNGLYVTHHPDEHEKWAEKIAENKRHKTLKKNKTAALV